MGLVLIVPLDSQSRCHSNRPQVVFWLILYVGL